MEFGVAQPPLAAWPHRKVVRYTQIMKVETDVAAERRRQEQAGQAAGRPGAGTDAAARAQATEEAFRRMRETAEAEAAAARAPTKHVT